MTQRYYSEERKTAILQKLLPPHNLSVAQIALQEGVSKTSLYYWLKKAKAEGSVIPPKMHKNPEDWSADDKFSTILETAALNTQELSEYCRSKGLYPEQITRWKKTFIQAVGQAKPEPLTRKNHKKIQLLEREIRRKDKALAEAAALLILQKKVQALWEEEES